MLIFFTKDHYGKDTKELPSSLLVWIIEHKEDWVLIQECKKELSERLKLDWQPQTDKDAEVKKLKVKNSKLEKKIDMMAKFLHIFGVEYIDTDKYYKHPQLLKEAWQDRVSEGKIILPYNFAKQSFYRDYMKEFRQENKQYYKQVEIK